MTMTTPRMIGVLFFFFNDTATTEIYTLSLHDALPISLAWPSACAKSLITPLAHGSNRHRSEEHTSELQSRQYLVCRLLLEKKKDVRTFQLLLCICVLVQS